MSTPIFQPVPSLLFVGEDSSLADECEVKLPHLSVLRVKHAAAAIERMPVTRPLVVVVDETVRDSDAGEVIACALDVAAEVVRTASQPLADAVERIRSAALQAESKRSLMPSQ